MIIISNTSPLIALAKIKHLFILPKLFTKILIPTIVAKEFQANCTTTEQRDFQACQALSLKTIDTTVKHHFTRRLDIGEQTVLSLALQQNLDAVLIDDRKAFNEAKEHGLMPISTRALLQTAVRLDIINDFSALESQLREKRFFLPKY